jgi:hypothetical protein
MRDRQSRRQLAAVAVALAVSVLAPQAPASADASSPTELRGRIAELAGRADRLRSQLRRERARSRAARRRHRAADTRAEALSRLLATRTAERDSVAVQARDFGVERDQARAQIAAIPTAFARAVEQVRREVDYSDLTLGPDSPMPREALIAHAAMSYVVGHVSAPGYGYMNVLLNQQPIPTAEGALAAGSGICGHAALTFAAIVKHFGLKVRSVQFYYADGVNNHISAEVFYDGEWHYYDPTWGAYYVQGGRVLSIEQARQHADPRSVLRQNGTLFWRSIQDLAGGPPLGDETDPATRVDIDKQPFPDYPA